MKNTITIAPILTKEEAVIKYSEMEANSTIELYDLTGRLLEEHSTIETTGTIVLTTSNYSSGNYILRISDDESESTFHKTITKL